MHNPPLNIAKVSSRLNKHINEYTIFFSNICFKLLLKNLVKSTFIHAIVTKKILFF